MGCDIHATIEVKKYKDGSWYGDVQNIEIPRNYWLFSVLAGVRGNEKPISQPRGVPKDCSFEYGEELEKWSGDGHSHSYFSFKELKDYSEKIYINKKSYFEEKFYKIMELYAKDYGDKNVRLVFFFDN